MSRKSKKIIRRWSVGVCIHILKYMALCLTWNMAVRCGHILGEIVFICSRKTRKQVIYNLCLVYPDLSLQKKYHLAQNVFRNLGQNLMECFKISQLSFGDIESMVDASAVIPLINATFDRNKSVMILTGHYSNWELFAARISQIAPLTVLARVNDNPKIQAMIDSMRRSMNIHVIDRDDRNAGRKIRSISQQGGKILGILMDQDTRVDGIFSPFLDHLAYTPTGPAVIALKDWFDVFVGFIFRDENGKYILRLNGPIPIQKTHDKTSDIQRATDQFNALIGKQIIEEPSQWVWFHRRWRRKPGELRNQIR